jgi:hypothetical protein
LRAGQRDRIGNRKTQTIANIFEAYFSDPDHYLNYLRGNAESLTSSNNINNGY